MREATVIVNKEIDMKEEALRLAYKLEESARFVYEMILERDHDSEIAKQLYMAQVKMAKEDENLAKVLRFLLAELDKKDEKIKELSDKNNTKESE